MKRRYFLKTSAGLISLIYSTENIPIMNDEVVHINVGNFKGLLLKDVQFKYLAKDFFINANPEELNSLAPKYHIVDGSIPSPFIPAYFETADRKILIDTGIGYSDKPVLVRGNTVYFKGRLHHLLKQENIQPDQVTDVIITHLHPDYIGGIYSDEGILNFPHATFYIHEDEWNYWHSSRSDNQPDQFKTFVAKNITPLANQNIHFIKGDYSELFAGITAIKAEGHTPGQIAISIQSNNDSLLYISDAFLHPLHIEKIDWQTNYDLDHDKARQSRLKLIDLAYKQNMLVNAFHFDFPGLGRIEKKKTAWKWNYSSV
jgi:glyoxylase-like metal-dependent hydrolase (beta-lactamase superfamily II)